VPQSLINTRNRKRRNLMSRFQKNPTMKYLKIVGYGPGGSGKTTFGTTMPGPRFWIDSEHSGDHIRNADDMVDYTTSFKDLQDDLKDATKDGAVSIIIDPITIFRDTLIDKVESETKNGMEFRDWAKVKKPDKRLTTDWQNAPCHVYITTHEKDETIMQKNDRGRMEPVKIGVKPDADKKLIYAPDIVLRFFVENGKHFAEIIKIRIRKDLAIKTGLMVGKIIENPTFDTFGPVVEAYSKGDAPAHYSDDRETSEKDEAVFTEIDKEQEDATKKKVVGQAQRGEKKAAELNIFGFRNEEELATTHDNFLGVKSLNDADTQDIIKYVASLSALVADKKKDVTNA
jgi:hypothetical protein